MSLADASTGFLGFRWDVWTLVGLLGTALFGSRFYIQWIVSEKRKASVVPVSFWWLSLAGSLLQLAYFTKRWEIVGILSFLPNSLIYIRNLQLIKKQKLAAPPPSGNMVCAEAVEMKETKDGNGPE